jgi:hypothetical protein
LLLRRNIGWWSDCSRTQICAMMRQLFLKGGVDAGHARF